MLKIMATVCARELIFECKKNPPNFFRIERMLKIFGELYLRKIHHQGL